MYGDGTKEMDSHKNMGPVHGPNAGHEQGGTFDVPDPLDYGSDENKAHKGAKKGQHPQGMPSKKGAAGGGY
jgi:hypothetical protein